MNAPRIAVVGLGAIGGSVALALLSRGIEPVAFSASSEDRALARAAGVRVSETLESAVLESDVVLIATPLDALPNVAASVAALAASASVFHAGSLLEPEALGRERALTSAVIGTHPMAGSHLSGFGAARADMFRDATVYVERRGTARQRADAELLWGLAGAARIELVEAAVHDAAMAWVSHAPQLVAKALAYAVANSPASDFRAGPGLLGTTRLAASDFNVWRPIFERAPDATKQALSEVMFALSEFRDALEAEDWTRMEKLWNVAGDWRRALETRP